MDRDVGRVATADRSDQAVVGRYHPALDRHRQRHLLLADQVEHPGQGLGARLPGKGVFHLVEADGPVVGEAFVGNIDLLGLAHETGREPGRPRDQAGSAAGGPEGEVSETVLDHHVADEALGPPARLRPAPGPVAPDGQRRIGVGEDEELEVLVAGRQPLEVGQDLVQRHRQVGPMEVEGGHRLEGDSGDHAERADRDTGRAQKVQAVTAAVDLEQLPVGGDQVQRHDLGRQVRHLRAGAVGAGRDRPGDRLLIDVTEVGHGQAEPVEFAVEVGQNRATPDLDQASREVGIENPGEAGHVDHQVLADRGGGEGVTGSRHGDPAPGVGGRSDQLLELGPAGRLADLLRRAALVAGPVGPYGGSVLAVARRHGLD